MIIRSIALASTPRPERLDGAASLRCKVQLLKLSLTTDMCSTFLFAVFHYANQSSLYLNIQARIFSFL